MRTNAYIDKKKKKNDKIYISVLKLTFLPKLLHTVILEKQIWLTRMSTFRKCNMTNERTTTQKNPVRPKSF